MGFFNKLDAYIKENTFDDRDYEYTVKIISLYMRKEGIEWNHLTLNMQQILIDFEKESKVKGIVPENAQLNHYLFL